MYICFASIHTWSYLFLLLLNIYEASMDLCLNWLQSSDADVVMVNVCVCIFESHLTWWHHDMEALSALLALCEGNPPVACGFPSQKASNAVPDLRLVTFISLQWCHTNITVSHITGNLIVCSLCSKKTSKLGITGPLKTWMTGGFQSQRASNW